MRSTDPCVESEREGGNFDQVWTWREIWGACRFAIFILIFIEYELMTSFRWCWFGWWHCQCLVRWLARCLDCWMSTWLAMMTEFFPANGAKKLSWRIWAFCCFKCYKWCIIKRILEVNEPAWVPVDVWMMTRILSLLLRIFVLLFSFYNTNDCFRESWRDDEPAWALVAPRQIALRILRAASLRWSAFIMLYFLFCDLDLMFHFNICNQDFHVSLSRLDDMIAIFQSRRSTTSVPSSS